MLTPDDFRALARSSPWLCTRAHFTVRRSGEQEVEAWLERPGSLRHRSGGGRVETLTHTPDSTLLTVLARAEIMPSSRETSLWGRDQNPVRRADGLVMELPTAHAETSVEITLDFDDPMLGNYEWVAMLNPFELSHHVELTEVREVTHHGRPAWAARCVPVEAYDPKCACCPLLWSEISDRYENDDDWTPSATYPSAYAVVLDRATGFVVSRRPVGGERTDLDLDVEIHSAN